MPAAPQLGFGPDARITARPEFQRVFSHGRKLAGRGAILWHYGDADSRRPARLGLSVGAKVGNAVRRNRLKRLTRETFRLNRASLKAGKDVVVYLRPACAWEGLAQAQKELLDLFGKAGLLA